MVDEAQPRGEAVDKNGYSLFRIELSLFEIPKPLAAARWKSRSAKELNAR
jgi:hypothetical protein